MDVPRSIELQDYSKLQDKKGGMSLGNENYDSGQSKPGNGAMSLGGGG